MTSVKVRVLNAVVDGKGPNTLISIDEQSVEALVKLGYVEVVKEDKPKSVALSVDTEEIVVEETVEEVKESAPKPTSKTRKTSQRQRNKSE